MYLIAIVTFARYRGLGTRLAETSSQDGLGLLGLLAVGWAGILAHIDILLEPKFKHSCDIVKVGSRNSQYLLGWESTW